MIKHLAELAISPVTTLLDARQARLRNFGVFGTAERDASRARTLAA
jgi:nucleoid DNA-binding protein